MSRLHGGLVLSIPVTDSLQAPFLKRRLSLIYLIVVQYERFRCAKRRLVLLRVIIVPMAHISYPSRGIARSPL